MTQTCHKRNLRGEDRKWARRVQKWYITFPGVFKVSFPIGSPAISAVDGRPAAGLALPVRPPVCTKSAGSEGSASHSHLTPVGAGVARGSSSEDLRACVDCCWHMTWWEDYYRVKERERLVAESLLPLQSPWQLMSHLRRLITAITWYDTCLVDFR